MQLADGRSTEERFCLPGLYRLYTAPRLEAVHAVRVRTWGHPRTRVSLWISDRAWSCELGSIILQQLLLPSMITFNTPAVVMTPGSTLSMIVDPPMQCIVDLVVGDNIISVDL